MVTESYLLLGDENSKFCQKCLFDSGQIFPFCSKLKSFIGVVALFYLVQSPTFSISPSVVRLDSREDNIAKQKQPIIGVWGKLSKSEKGAI